MFTAPETIRFDIAARCRAGARRWAGLLLAGCLLVPRGPAGEPPGHLRITPVQQLMGVSFTPGTTEWVGLEASEDLETWTPVVEVAARTSAVLYVDIDPASRSHRLFRVRSPGLALAEARARWAAASSGHYTLRFERLNPTPPFVLSARVTVRDGVKEVTDGLADGAPVAEVESFLFPSVEELFGELEQAKAEPIRQLWVTYDPVLGVPQRCTLDRRTLGTSLLGIAQYRVTNLVVFPRP